jgi:hypothetical protein
MSVQISPGSQPPPQTGGVTAGSSQGGGGVGTVVEVVEVVEVVVVVVLVVLLLVVVERQQSWQAKGGERPTAFCRTISASTAVTLTSLLTSPQG